MEYGEITYTPEGLGVITCGAISRFGGVEDVVMSREQEKDWHSNDVSH